MKIPSSVSTLTIPRLLAATIAFAMSGCAIVAQPPGPGVNASPGNGVTTVTGEDLQRTGRTNTGQALRALLPIFH